MTLEEAKSLKAGDRISCAGCCTRDIISCNILWTELHWREKGSNSDHSWAYKDIILVSKGDAIINNYPIY